MSSEYFQIESRNDIIHVVPKKLHNYSSFQAYCLKPLQQQVKYLHNYNYNCALVQYYNSTIYYTIFYSTLSNRARKESPLSRQITTFDSVLSKYFISVIHSCALFSLLTSNCHHADTLKQVDMVDIHAKHQHLSVVMENAM